jgi:hypothetical protein
MFSRNVGNYVQIYAALRSFETSVIVYQMRAGESSGMKVEFEIFSLLGRYAA